MDNEKLLRDLILLSGKPCRDFCKDVLIKSIKVNESYENYVFLTLVLLRYLEID